MKKTFISAIFLLVAVVGMAQTVPDRMTVTLKNGTQTTYVIDEIEEVSFSTSSDQPDVPSGVYAFSMPDISQFSSSQVLKVISKGTPVAEVAYEYIKPENKRMVVAYALKADGKADLSKGIAADGGTVVWNETDNTCVYTTGEAAVSKLYVVNGALETSSTEEAKTTVLLPDVISDTRGGQSKTYAIVKIGTQYWMAENLATTFFSDGSAIELCTGNQMDAWKANTTGAYHILHDDAENAGAIYGYMYNGYAVMSDKGLAPEGWEIPTYDQWSALKKYGGSASSNYKSDVEDSWTDNLIGTNLTGFNALPGGYFDTTNGDQRDGNEIYFWSSTSVYDALLKKDAIIPTRLTGTGKSFVVSNFSTHDYNFGHYVRCVRK